MNRRTKLIVTVVAVVVAIGGYAAMVAFMGAELGEPCDKEWGCRGADAVCLTGDHPFCSRHCKTASECPTGWRCGDVTVYTLDGKSPAPEVSATPVCLPSAPTRGEADGARGGARGRAGGG